MYQRSSVGREGCDVIEAIGALAVLSMVLSVFALLLSIGAVLRVQRAQASPMESYKSIPDGSEVPGDVLAKLLEGDSLYEWLEGPTLLSFVSDSCPACLEFVVALNQMTLKGLHLLIVAPDGATDLRVSATFPALWATDSDRQARTRFEIKATPHTFLLHQGRIQAQHVGSAVEGIVSKGMAAVPATTTR
jgi:hypothetical protein